MADTTVVKSLITPQDQTLRTVFSAQCSYYIDIYQREYKWKAEQVRTLLDDIEVRFSQHERHKTQPKEIREDVLERFEPYFLNTYLTHKTPSNTFIVDGQQRLTTLLLVLIKLNRVLKTMEKDPATKTKTFSSKVVEQFIFETNDFGEAERFKIHNDNREEALRALVEEKQVIQTDQTRTRIAENFAVISQYFEEFLKGVEPGNYDPIKTTYYLTFLMDRISIVEIRIERQDNVAMIFEVVNDRGLGLSPYEILKGKLIGNLPQQQKEKANTVWTNLQEQYFKARLKNTTEATLDLDMFFQTFFRAKFADTETDYERFEGDYHYQIYRDHKIKAFFGNFQNRDLLIKLIVEDIKYYAELYLELRTSYDHDHLIFNKLLDQNQQYLLIMSAMKLEDVERTEKITGIAAKFDQFHVILRLLDAYESTTFQRLIYPINKEVRAKSIKEIASIFDKALIETLVEDGILQKNRCAQASDIFDFERFKGVRNQWTNFSKYVLTRIDRHLAECLDKPSYAGESLEDLETRFNKNNRQRYGMHLEHIYTQHPANRAVFTDEKGVFNEAVFNQTRNLLGMVLLLKDKQNLSSNNEIYRDKQKTYSLSNLIWNELLVGHLSNVDTRNLPSDLHVTKISPAAEGVFPRDQVEERQKSTYAAIKAIWGFA